MGGATKTSAEYNPVPAPCQASGAAARREECGGLAAGQACRAVRCGGAAWRMAESGGVAARASCGGSGVGGRQKAAADGTRTRRGGKVTRCRGGPGWGVEEGLEFVGGRQGVPAQGLQEVGGQVAQGAEACLDVPLAADAALEELGEEVGDLEEEVEVLGRGGVLGVGVFHRVAAVLLDVEAFILGAPALSSSLVGESGWRSRG